MCVSVSAMRQLENRTLKLNLEFTLAGIHEYEFSLYMCPQMWNAVWEGQQLHKTPLTKLKWHSVMFITFKKDTTEG